MKDIEGEQTYVNIKVQKVVLNGVTMSLLLIKDVSDYYKLIEAQESEKFKDLVVATASHELRTPLNGIMTMLHILKSKIKDPSKLQYLQIADNTAQLMYNLVNDMLDLSTLNADKFK